MSCQPDHSSLRQTLLDLSCQQISGRQWLQSLTSDRESEMVLYTEEELWTCPSLNPLTQRPETPPALSENYRRQL